MRLSFVKNETIENLSGKQLNSPQNTQDEKKVFSLYYHQEKGTGVSMGITNAPPHPHPLPCLPPPNTENVHTVLTVSGLC